MGRPALRLGDIGSGHDCHYPPTVAIEGSSNVFINDRPAVRVGHAYAPHGCPECDISAHPRKLKEGAPSVFINDNESGLHRDFERWLEKLAPEKPHDQYDHNGYEDNADAHLKRSVMGREVVVAVTDGKLDFGTWEQIFYGEFDGMRDKRVLVKIIGE